MSLVNRLKAGIASCKAKIADAVVSCKAKIAAAFAVPLLAIGNAHAQSAPIDVSDVVGVITGGVTTVSAIGVAVLSLVVVIKLFKWVQRTL